MRFILYLNFDIMAKMITIWSQSITMVSYLAFKF